MAKRLIEVQVRVTSVVTYRLPRPTKAEIIEANGGDPDSWDKDDPMYSIQEYIEEQGFEDFIQGYRPVSVSIDEMEIDHVDEPAKGASPSQVTAPQYKIRTKYRKEDGSWFWLWWGPGNDWISPKNRTYGDDIHQLAATFTEGQARRIRHKIKANGFMIKYIPEEMETVPKHWRPTASDPLEGTE